MALTHGPTTGTQNFRPRETEVEMKFERKALQSGISGDRTFSTTPDSELAITTCPDPTSGIRNHFRFVGQYF